MSTRENLLDAFEQILIAEGERAATMDAVAALAAVSKGGLLYHFRSKDALVDGLVERLTELAQQDVARMACAEQGPSAYYVGTSAYQGSALDRALVATARLVQDANPAASEAMRRLQQDWYELIAAEVGDRAVARAILLLGDGLYYNAALAGGTPGVTDATAPEDLAELLGVVELLKEQATR
ncbi:TetR/AcrR family transcriptional regulator [Georgenia sunbinii]|uniref:TetR/AcrR family transcriptional regulator n=1 Tax=Georgenia sunbinii TaxID=3117728 RepID=UPI002F266AFB